MCPPKWIEQNSDFVKELDFDAVISSTILTALQNESKEQIFDDKETYAMIFIRINSGTSSQQEFEQSYHQTLIYYSSGCI